MTNGEAVNWLINLTADIGKAEHRDLWHYEQALYEIRDMLESDVVQVIRCKDCKSFDGDDWCHAWGGTTVSDAYCSYAERRTDETD